VVQVVRDPDPQRCIAGEAELIGHRDRDPVDTSVTGTAAEEVRPALVVLEVRLGDVSGYEICRRLREDHGESLPILFVSGDRTDASDRVEGLLVGADDYLAKPIAADELVARVQRHLHRLATWKWPWRAAHPA
jgi:DNA-binding response OmpR family regulator